MAKFNVGDIVVGTKKASTRYRVTGTGCKLRVLETSDAEFLGALIHTPNPHHARWVGETYTVSYTYFVKESEKTEDNTPKTSDEERICDHCGCVIKAGEEYIIFDGKTLCEDCECDETFICDECGEREWRDNGTFVDNNENFVCDECLDYYYRECACCGAYYHRDSVYLDVDGNFICEDCRESYYYTCTDCGELVHEDDVIWDDEYENYFCRCCYEEHERRASRVIHDYYYKPTPIFYGSDDRNALYMGVELEIDGAGEYHENAKEIIATVNEDNSHVYAKHDGSLSRGFEIVSHPATLEYHTENIAWQRLMTKALSMEYRSHETQTCGLHIHVSRKALGDDWDEREQTIEKIVYFIEKHWKKVLRFTRRSEYALQRWASRYGKKYNAEETYKDAKDCCDRYKCINLQNDNTVEFRMFRGTLKHSTFIATLQFVAIVCDLCKKHTVKSIERLSWNKFVDGIDCEKYPELVEYLKNRGLTVDALTEVEENESGVM